jgi:hypothetical protein
VRAEKAEILLGEILLITSKLLFFKELVKSTSLQIRGAVATTLQSRTRFHSTSAR